MRFCLLIVSAIFFFGCSSEPESTNTAIEKGLTTLRINENENFISLHPHEMIDPVSIRIASQVYEGLVRFTTKGDTVEKCLASSIEIDSSKTKYTFTLKKAIFHTSSCFKNEDQRIVDAYDVESSFKQLFRKNKNNLVQYLLIDVIKGAQAFQKLPNYKQDSLPVSGIKVLDNKTIEFTLNKPDAEFLYKIATPAGFIFPREAPKFYFSRFAKNPVGTGPFFLRYSSDLQEDFSLLLHKNKGYHIQGLPKIDLLIFEFVKDKRTEFEKFLAGELDIIHHLNPKEYKLFLDKNNPNFNDYNAKSCPELITYYLGFNNLSVPFNKTSIRNSFSQAINHDSIYKYVLAEQPAFTPSLPLNDILINHDFYNKGDYLKYDLDSAKKLLLKAGYTIENPFPQLSLPLAAHGNRKSAVAFYIKEQLKKKLNIKLEINTIPVEFLQKDILQKKYRLYLDEFCYLYPSLHFMMDRLRTNNLKYPNTLKFSNADYDIYAKQAMETKNPSDYIKAEKVLMKQTPYIPLWHENNHFVSQYKVKGLVWSSLPYLDLREVSIEKPIRVKPIE